MNGSDRKKVNQSLFGRFGKTVLGAVILPAVLMVGAQSAGAQDGTGDTLINGCMDELFPGNLGCTANDVRVSGVADVTGDMIIDEDDITFKPVCDVGASNAGIDCSSDASICLDVNGSPTPDLCGDRCAFPGDTTSFAATFIFELSAQARYDIGAYFATDGDPNGDGALTGTCSISTLPEVGAFTRPDGTGGSFVDLDTTCKGGGCPQPEDLCGDINDDNNPLFYDLSTSGEFITAECVDPDANGKLNLPNCTSWRQSGANEVCLSPLDAFPGSPSKCNCDPTFELPINVPPAELQVVKTATPSTVDEPGEVVQFDVAVTNTGIDPNNNVTLNSLSDDIYGDITKDENTGNLLIISTTCSVPQSITPGGTYTCSFNALVGGNGGDSQTDIVTAKGVDDNGNPLEGEDDAKVDIIDVLPAISVTKTANPTSVTEPGGNVTFTVVVSNDSTADPLTITSLTDESPLGTLPGDIGGICLDSSDNSLIDQTIQQGGADLTCTFTVFVAGNAGEAAKVDRVTVEGVDDEFVDDATTPDNKVSAMDTASVSITDSPAMIEVTKTANPTSLDEPGGDVDFTVVVNNLSAVDPLTITSLTDTRPYTMTPGSDPVIDIGSICLDASDNSLIGQTIVAGGSLTCMFTVAVTGDASDDPPGETDLVKVEATDNDVPPNTVSDDDDATVTLNDVPPAASLSKTATMVVARFDVVVTNDSGAESLTLTILDDDQFGNITAIDGATILDSSCSVPQTLDPNDGLPGGTDTYSCWFDAKINADDLVDGAHVNEVTGTVSDNEGGSVTPSDSATVTFE